MSLSTIWRTVLPGDACPLSKGLSLKSWWKFTRTLKEIFKTTLRWSCNRNKPTSEVCKKRLLTSNKQLNTWKDKSYISRRRLTSWKTTWQTSKTGHWTVSVYPLRQIIYPNQICIQIRLIHRNRLSKSTKIT
jgi:hypothetical protein